MLFIDVISCVLKFTGAMISRCLICRSWIGFFFVEGFVWFGGRCSSGREADCGRGFLLSCWEGKSRGAEDGLKGGLVKLLEGSSRGVRDCDYGFVVN